MTTKQQSNTTDPGRIQSLEQLSWCSRGPDQPRSLPLAGARHFNEQERHSFSTGQILQRSILPTEVSTSVSNPSRSPRLELSDRRFGKPQAAPSVPPIPPEYSQSVSPGQSKVKGRYAQRRQSNKIRPTLPSSDSDGFYDARRGNEDASITAPKKNYRISQVLDTRLGHVHRRQLSKCLQDILDPSFEVPQLLAHALDVNVQFGVGRANTRPEPDLNNRQLREHSVEFTPNNQQSDQELTSEACFFSGCQCHPGAVICHCQSSEDFKRFQHWHRERKANSSIDSNVCMLAVPRARFGVVPAPDDDWCPKSTGSRLSWSSETNMPDKATVDFRQWPLPASTESSKSSNSWMTVAESSSSKQCAKDFKVSSFSRPIRHEGGCSPRLYLDSSQSSFDSNISNSPLTPCSSAWRSTTLPQSEAKIARLDSVSTLSTFHLDLDIKDTVNSFIPRKLVKNKSSADEMPQYWHRSAPITYSTVSGDTGFLDAVEELPGTGHTSKISAHESFSTVKLATAIVKPIMVTTRPISDTNRDGASLRQSLATSQHRVAGPVLSRPKLVNLKVDCAITKPAT